MFRLFCPQVSFIIKTLFPPLRGTLYAGRVKLLAEGPEIFTHALFQFVAVRKTASSEGLLQGSKKMIEGAKSGL
jgi:hypothetical protein